MVFDIIYSLVCCANATLADEQQQKQQQQHNEMSMI